MTKVTAKGRVIFVSVSELMFVYLPHIDDIGFYFLLSINVVCLFGNMVNVTFNNLSATS